MAIRYENQIRLAAELEDLDTTIARIRSVVGTFDNTRFTRCNYFRP